MRMIVLAFWTALATLWASSTYAQDEAPPTVVHQIESSVSDPISPTEAIAAAAEVAPTGVIEGVFAFTVRAGGRHRGMLYLNSELDYRDQRNLSLDISPRVELALRSQYGDEVLSFFVGKLIAVSGQARRVRIDFIDDDERPTGLYYYQTHVPIWDPAQITVLD